MPSHALKEPFTRTSNCTTMLQCSLSVIGNFRVDHAKQALSVYVARWSRRVF